ncbi:monosaccharide ABC transporter ATP-binding protein, CUT2 family [Anaerolinea thermolimosa]|uniref:sugar ABC transporter ATP-binding protein n=1 Tax=Anaerolinea thermolimosa TaxID=229919 RepID=UPI000785E63F|nr:sugar ABC transporter ATP-binding protein [Anaerolinea thermolimosa]GAP06426.1 monosaccharide ABC transporter ATP-binding protein, CUT2 family [Anaerolinea thermolimosa]
MDDPKVILSAKGITKSFPGVTALEDVDFSLRRGEIHALMGENGAGKSTLIKIITGVEHADRGTLEYDGRQIEVHSPLHAQQIGISTVYQEVNLCTNISVAENIMLGREPQTWFGAIHWRKMNRLAADALHRLGIDIDVTRPLGSYSVAIQQMVAIARSLEISSAQVLILDEPTSSLDVHETRQLFDVMLRLKEQGIGIIFITHFLDQVYQVADRITVLRNGRLVGTYPTEMLPRIQLIASMLGRSSTDLEEVSRVKFHRETTPQNGKLLELHGLGRKGSLEPIDLELRSSEVVGIAGLLGSGRTEMANLIFGIDSPDLGFMTIEEKKVTRFSPLESINAGVGLCPENRKEEGIVGDMTLRENIILALQARLGWFKHLSHARQDEIASHFIQVLGIVTPSADQLVKNLSGGNQQKVILARWLATNPQVLILDEPTRGIDVGAKAEIQRLVLELAEEGKSCIFISSELEEVMRCSHRIVVLRDRKKAAEFPGNVDDETIMKTMAGNL